MPRPKKDAVSLNIKLATEVSNMLEEYCKETGQPKTTAIERILDAAFKDYFSQPEGKRIPK
ncbi:MAG: hypothetical protein IKE28_02320 [Solobacterium sp.]|nr:hypothetical protein [Solobacterium sp.]